MVSFIYSLHRMFSRSQLSEEGKEDSLTAPETTQKKELSRSPRRDHSESQAGVSSETFDDSQWIYRSRSRSLEDGSSKNSLPDLPVKIIAPVSPIRQSQLTEEGKKATIKSFSRRRRSPRITSILSRPTTIRRHDKSKRIIWDDNKGYQTKDQNQIDHIYSETQVDKSVNSKFLPVNLGNSCVFSGEMFGKTRQCRPRSSENSRSLISTNPMTGISETITKSPETRENWTYTHNRAKSAPPRAEEEEFDYKLKETTDYMLQQDVDNVLNDNYHATNNEIIENFSPCIKKAFYTELDKIHTKLKEAFSCQLDETEKSKKLEIVKIQKVYRDRLLDLETSVENFQEWIDTLSQENQCLQEEKEALALEVKNLQIIRMSDADIQLEKQINDIESKHEEEKQQLQDYHILEIKSITEKFSEQVKKLEDQFKVETEALEVLVEELKVQNNSLSENLEASKKRVTITNDVDNGNFDREELLRHIAELKEMLANSEHDKTLVVLAHNDEIAELHQEMSQLNQHMNELIREYTFLIENLKKEREDDMAEMNERLYLKDKEYKSAMNALRTRYGTQITELTQSVVDLQKQVIVDEIENTEDEEVEI